jgi:hypothetical protein
MFSNLFFAGVRGYSFTGGGDRSSADGQAEVAAGALVEVAALVDLAEAAAASVAAVPAEVGD